MVRNSRRRAQSTQEKLSSNFESAKNMRFWKNLILFALFVVAVRYWVKTKSYAFDEKIIIEVGSKFAGEDLEETIKNIISDLDQQLPGVILPEQYREWLMVQSGGWIGSTKILYASLTEYIAVTGTAISSQGHSGRHFANLTGVILSGSVKGWKEGTIEAVAYHPKDTMTIRWGEAFAFEWEPDTWMLEYGRGFIPFSMPFFTADSIFSSFDILGLCKVWLMFARAIFYMLKMEFVHLIANI